MRIDPLTPEATILTELGKRLALVRKQHNMSQEQLAQEAGVGVATLRRIETGAGSQMESWLKILKTLGLTASIDQLLPETFASPMAEAIAAGRTRKTQRNSGKKKGSKRWGDESK